MVNRTMGHRARALVGVLAVLSLLLLALAPATATDRGAPASTSGRAAAISSARADRPAPAAPLSGAPIVSFAVFLAAAAAATGVFGRRQRLDDDGDDWRSLLVGAPPALA
jgi:hypothetical protein